MSIEKQALDSLGIMNTDEKMEAFHREIHNPQFDENYVDELGIRPEEVLLKIKEDEDIDENNFTDEDYANVYMQLRVQKSVELAIENLVEEGRAELGTCPDTGEQTVRIFSDEEFQERQQNA